MATEALANQLWLIVAIGPNFSDQELIHCVSVDPALKSSHSLGKDLYTFINIDHYLYVKLAWPFHYSSISIWFVPFSMYFKIADSIWGPLAQIF